MQAEAANIGFRVAARRCVLADPQALMLDKDGSDILLGWADPGQLGPWNVYRGPSPDPADWGGPHAAGVTDQNPFAEGVQYRDVGATQAGSILFYRVTGLNSCGESSLD